MNQSEQAEHWVKTYTNAIFRLSYTYLKNTYDAQDVCQTVFLKLLTNPPPNFENQAKEKAYILRVAANICKDMLKSPWRKNLSSLETYADIPAPKSEASEVFTAVNSLPIRYRSVIHLYYYEGYQAEQISEILGITESAVYTRLKRGRDKLKKILGGIENETYG